MKYLFTIFLFISLKVFSQPSTPITIQTTGSASGNAKAISLGFNASAPPVSVIKIPIPGDYNRQGVYFYFKTDKYYTTSCGIFNPDGSLLKTLWSNIGLGIGTHQGYWDGTDDYGHYVDEGNYTVKILTNNVYYTWEGGIGNTSTLDTGITSYHGYGGMNFITIAGTSAYSGQNYNEGNTAAFKFLTSAINTKIEILPNGTSNNTNQQPLYGVTDSNYVYFAGFDPFAGSKHFVYAIKAIADTEITTFSSGTSYKCSVGRTYKSAIDLITNSNATCTGLAVQKTGNYLFVAHGKLNQLDVLNKSTGAIVQTLTFTNIQGLCRDGNDNLWMIYGSPQVVQKFIVNGDGTLTASTPTISGLAQPLSIDVAPSNATIVVCDGLTSQQLKAFSTIDGSSRWTFGTIGGYRQNSTVADNKFYFTDSATISTYNGHAFVTYAADSSLWVGDMGNARAQHLSATDRSFIERLQYMPSSYSVGIDQNDSTRIFSDFKEFKLDYTKTLDNGSNGSWVLYRNWGQGMWSPYIANKYSRLYSIATLSNGHTYALMQNSSNNSKWDVVELVNNGVMRVTNVTGLQGPVAIARDGSLKAALNTHTVGQPYYFYSSPLTGFDGSNNPIWGTQTTTITYNSLGQEDPYVGGPFASTKSPNLKSANGFQVVWNADEETSNYTNWHIGAMSQGANSKMMWRSARSTTTQNNSFFPVNGDYDIGNITNFAGGPAGVVDHHIIWGYHGEGWKNTQCNKWNHLYDDGLMIGQFGVTGNDSIVKAMALTVAFPAAPGMSGNELSGYFFKLSDSVGALIHCDESYHGFVHFWKIHNMNTVSELTMPITLTTIPTKGLTGYYYDSTDLNNFSVKTTRRDSTIHFDWGSSIPSGTSVVDPTNFAVRWLGYMKADYSETYTFYASATNGVRLWVDSVLVVDHWDNTSLTEYSGTISLTVGKKYFIRYETNGGGSVYLQYSSASQTKGFIPQSKLFPYYQPSTGWTDLLEGFWYNKEWTQAQLYGWQRNPPGADLTNKNTQYWSVVTNYMHYQKEMTSDLRMLFIENTTPSIYTMPRDLGTQNVTNSWEVKAIINFNGTVQYNDGTKYGQYFEVLDAAGKVLARYYINQPALTGTVTMFGNTKTITSTASKSLMDNIARYSHLLDIKCSNGNVTITYGEFSPVTDVIFDGTGNWQQPKTVRMYYYHTGSAANYGRIINIESLQFTGN